MEDARLESLERDLRRLRRVVPMLGLGFALLLAWQFMPGPPTVQARSFVMVDGKGAKRAAIEMVAGTKPALRLNDAHGKARVLVLLDPDRGGSFTIRDSTGENRIRMGLTGAGIPQLSLANERGRTRTLVRVADPEGHLPGFVVFDADLNWEWWAPRY